MLESGTLIEAFRDVMSTGKYCARRWTEGWVEYKEIIEISDADAKWFDARRNCTLNYYCFNI